MQSIWAVYLFVTGLCLGSFVNALVWRIYQHELPKKKRAASDERLSLTKGRSMCPSCKHELGLRDLVPVLSWLQLQGKCRYCRNPISWQYPVVELATAIIFLASFLLWPHEFDAEGIFLLVNWLAGVVLLMALLVYDARWMLLPNKLVFPFIGLGVLQTIVGATVFDGGIGYVLNSVGGLLVAGGIFFVLFQLSKGAWIGGGDVKLGYGLGLYLASPVLAFVLLFVASLLGLLAAIPGMLSKKVRMSSRIPFGPFLIIGCVLVMLFGADAVEWYKQYILLVP